MKREKSQHHQYSMLLITRRINKEVINLDRRTTKK